MAELEAHQHTRLHKDVVVRASTYQGAPVDVVGVPAAPGYLQCSVCQKVVHVDVWISHTTRHTSYQRRQEVDAVLREAERDKHGVSVSYKNGIDFGMMGLEEALREDMRRVADVKVQSTDSSAIIGLFSIRLSSSQRGDHYGEK